MINSPRNWLRSFFTPSLKTDAATGWRPRLVRPLLAGALAVGLLALLPAAVVHWGVRAAVLVTLLYLLLGAAVVMRASYRWQLVGMLLIIYVLGLAELSGWQRHVVLIAIAYSFLQNERRRHGQTTLTLPRVRAVIQEVLTAHFFMSSPTT